MKSVTEESVKIGDITFTFRFSIRAMMLFYDLTGKDISNIKSMNDMIIFTYCGYEANHIYNKVKEPLLSLDDYINMLDDNPSSISSISQLLTEINSRKKK